MSELRGEDHAFGLGGFGSLRSLVLCIVLFPVFTVLHASNCLDDLLARSRQYTENPARVLATGMQRGLQQVRVDKRRIGYLARKIVELQLDLSIPPWNWPPYLEQSEDFESVFEFFLTLNSINYKYFETGSEREFSDGGINEALLTATRIAHNWGSLAANGYEKLRLADESYLRDDLFRAEHPMPMLSQRVAAFRELGGFLSTFHEGGHTWLDTLSEIRNPAAFAYALPWVLPSWRDPFLKRSQLLVFMTMGRAGAMGVDLFDSGSVAELTVAADYMLPRILYAMGAIDYRDRASLKRIQQRVLVPSGSQLEVEVRAATILATEALVQAIKEQGMDSVSAAGIDAFLWTVATGNFNDGQKLKAVQEQMFRRPLPPFHHTETTDY